MPAPSLEQILAELTQAFPHPAVPATTARVYMRELDGIPTPTLAAAVRELIRTRERFPPLSLVLAACAELTLALPGEADALAQIERRISWGRSDDDRGPVPPVDPIVAEAVSHVGGYYAFREAEKPEVIRGQFSRIFKELRAAAIRDAQVGSPAALDAGPRLRALPGGAAA